MKPGNPLYYKEGANLSELFVTAGCCAQVYRTIRGFGIMMIAGPVRDPIFLIVVHF